MPVCLPRDDVARHLRPGVELLRLTLTIAACLLPAWAARAQQVPTKSPQPARPAYPRISLSSGYEVDGSWPSRPSDLSWGAMAGIAIDPRGQVWLFNRGPKPLQVFTPEGRLVRTWGEGQFREPHQIRFDREGNLWLADSGLHVVRKFDPDGTPRLTLGEAGVPGDDSAHFNRPTDMAIAPSGDVFVSDGYGNNRIVHFDRDGKFVKAWGSLGTRPGQFSLPHSIAVDSRGTLYVADRNNARVQVFDQDGTFLAEWDDLMVPWHIVINDRDEIHVCGSSPMRWPPLPIPGLPLGIPPKDQLVIVFDPSGRVRRLWTFPKGQSSGALDWVHAMAVDGDGNLYLGDIQGRRGQKFRRLEPAVEKGDRGLAGRKAIKSDSSVERTGKSPRSSQRP